MLLKVCLVFCVTLFECMVAFGDKEIVQEVFRTDDETLAELCSNYTGNAVTNAMKTATDVAEQTTSATPPLYTMTMKYGYGTAAVTVISILAFVGILAIPALGSRTYDLTMQCFIALGIGSLSGDALFHLMPYVLGIHGHDDYTYLWKMCVCVGGIWVLFLFENFIRIWANSKGETQHHHHHHHHHHQCQDNNFDMRPDHEDHVTKTTSFTATDEIVAASNQQKPEKNGFQEQTVDKEKTEDKFDVEKGSSTLKYFGMPVVALMIFVGDALHNFGDGLALGVAFSESWVTGVGTSLAIFCHELPHEFSDFALYLNSGLSVTKALVLNFAAACCCYIGMFIGVAISDDETVRPWVTALIAGVFLYVTFVNVFPELRSGNTSRPYLIFFLQNLGMLAGWGILLVLARFEEDIEESFK